MGEGGAGGGKQRVSGGRVRLRGSEAKKGDGGGREIQALGFKIREGM